MKLWYVMLMLIGGTMVWAPQTQAGEESVYDFLWLDPDKAVYVLQNKIHKKENTFYMDAGYVTSFSGAFNDTRGVAVKGGYYFHEEWAVEALYLGYQNNRNDNYNNVKLVNGAVPFVRRPTSTIGAGLVWSPFYGKINTFNKIVHFDWYFGFGAAMVNTQSNLKTVRNNTAADTYDSETRGGGYLKSGVKFHLNQNWHVGVEWMGTYYNAPGPRNPKQDKFRSQNDMIIQLGWSY